MKEDLKDYFLDQAKIRRNKVARLSLYRYIAITIVITLISVMALDAFVKAIERDQQVRENMICEWAYQANNEVVISNCK